MKKITLLIMLFFAIGNTFAQTIVSTTPANKNGLLEEFTGIHCGFCPQGHAIANNIKANNPNTFYIINVHTGGYAIPGTGEPDFRTEFGSAIANQSQLSGYPSGTISRHYFGHSQDQAPNGATALSRGSWSSDFNTLKTQSAYVNVGVEAEINIASREITVHVEAYYTGDSPESTNLLNVALLQNHTAGPQSGGNAGNNYDHNHRLVHLLTGQWGENITTTTQGTFIDRTFTYTVPVEYNDIWADMSNLEVVAFITETHQEVANVKGASVTTTGTLVSNDAVIAKIKNPKGNCELNIAPKITLYNSGQNALTSLSIEYNINGGVNQTYNWSGTINSLHIEEITLPLVQITVLEANNNIEATITNSDEDSSNNSFTTSFTKQEFLPETFEDIHVFIATDNWGYELTWEIKNSSNVTVASGGGAGSTTGPVTGSYANNTQVTETYNLPEDCYKLIVNDAYGDGGNAVVVRTTDDQTNVVFVAGGYGAGDDVSFKTSSTAAVESLALENVNLYPNPSNGLVTIAKAKDFTLSIFNVLGKQVYQSTLVSDNEQIDLSKLNSGVYLVNISDNLNTKTKKLIIK